jgi:hypothetical protein
MNESENISDLDIIDLDVTPSVVSKIQKKDNHDSLHDLSISDNYLSKPRRMSELLATDKPIIPIPADTMLDTVYVTRMETRCVLCRSPWRERAEHWYLENGRRPNSVVNFFKKYFNVNISWECVDTHMSSHCTLDSLGRNGLVDLESQEADMARWRYRELDLAITGTLSEISDIRGMSCKNKPDLMLRRAGLLNQLYARLVDYKKMRDEASVNVKVDVFSVLMEVYQKLPDDDSRKILLATVQELREQYT